MALYVSYAVGSSVALYLGSRIFGGASEPEIAEVESSSNKYIVREDKDSVEIMDLKVDELDESQVIEDEEDLYRCSKCDNMLKINLFSKRQRKKDKSLWKCKVCSKLK